MVKRGAISEETDAADHERYYALSMVVNKTMAEKRTLPEFESTIWKTVR